ncbi:MAG: type II toxin-antitoxin system Phd/YefM family antitoxin [Acidimicrobiia bacterium]
MRVIPASEFKQKVLKLIDAVAATGEEIVVSKHGRPMVKLVPLQAGEGGRPLQGCLKIVDVNDDLELDEDWEAAGDDRPPQRR